VQELTSINGKENNIKTEKGKRRTQTHKREWKWRMVKKRKDGEIRESLWMVRSCHTTWRRGYSKMSGEELSLEVLCTQDKTQR